MKAVEGVKKFQDLSIGLLGTFAIRHTSEKAEIVSSFLHGKSDYKPSWRRVIYSLDRAGEIQLADSIRCLGEPVQG